LHYLHPVKSKLEEIHEQLWSTCTHIRINTNLNFEFKEAKVHIGQWCHLRSWRRNFEFVLHTSCLETKIFLTYGTCVPLYFTYQWQDTLKTQHLVKLLNQIWLWYMECFNRFELHFKNLHSVLTTFLQNICH
jgi:aromatic ring-opening dioxygenase LigB subunit